MNVNDVLDTFARAMQKKMYNEELGNFSVTHFVKTGEIEYEYKKHAMVYHHTKNGDYVTAPVFDETGKYDYTDVVWSPLIAPNDFYGEAIFPKDKKYLDEGECFFSIKDIKSNETIESYFVIKKTIDKALKIPNNQIGYCQSISGSRSPKYLIITEKSQRILNELSK